MASTSSSGLCSLPPELLHYTLDLCDKGTLHHLCLVCRQLRDEAQPRLFRDYEQPDYPDQPTLLPFLRVVVQRPDLGRCVRSLLIYAWTHLEPVPEKPIAAISHDGGDAELHWRASADKMIQRLQSELWSDMTIDLLENRDDLDGSLARKIENDKIFLLVLAHTPMLEELNLDLPVSHSFLAPLFQHLQQSSHPLRLRLENLRSLQLDYADSEDGWSIPALLPFLELPALSELRGHKCVDAYGGYQGQICRPQSMNMKHIDLVCTVLCMEAIGDLVRGCKALKTFRIAFGSPTVGGLFRVDFDALTEAFAAHRDTLSSLVIDISLSSATDCLEEAYGVMRLATFSQLRHVDLPSLAFLGRDADTEPLPELLPQSLEELILRGYESALAGMLGTNLLSMRSLKRVRLLGERWPDSERVAAKEWCETREGSMSIEE